MKSTGRERVGAGEIGGTAEGCAMVITFAMFDALGIVALEITCLIFCCSPGSSAGMELIGHLCALLLVSGFGPRNDLLARIPAFWRLTRREGRGGIPSACNFQVLGQSKDPQQMKRIALYMSCLGLLSPMLEATSIAFVGIETGTTVENWSNTSEPKSQDLNGDDRFGGAGYYQIMPATIGTDPTVLTVKPEDELGISLDLSGASPGTLNTASLTPTFLSGIPEGGTGEFINTPDFPNYTNPSGTSQIRQGSIWLDTPLNQGTMPGGITGYSSTAFSFTLSKAADFRLGVAVDAMSFGGAAPDFVSICKVGGVDVFSDLLDRNGVSDMVFFKVNGNAGEEFVVKLWQADPNRTAFALITFDQAPTPTPTLTYTLVDGNIILSWEQNIAGWVLESSTDLGVGDAWDPVPGVDYENNSVSVPMTGVPNNFFRLKKNP